MGVIGLSATLPNVQLLANWLQADLYVSTDRPVPLKLALGSGGRMEDAVGTAPGRSQEAMRRDPDGFCPLVTECLAESLGVLVFCATKDWCEKATLLLADDCAVTLPANEQRHSARLLVLEELR